MGTWTPAPQRLAPLAPQAWWVAPVAKHTNHNHWCHPYKRGVPTNTTTHHTHKPTTTHKAQGTKDLVVCGWHGAQLGAFHPQQQQEEEEEEEEEERTEREGEGTGRKGEAASTAPVSGGGVMATRGLAPSHKPPTTKPIHHHSLTHTHTGRKRKRTRKKTGQDKGQGVVGWCGGWQDHHKASWLVTTSVLGPHPTLCPLPCLALPCLGLAGTHAFFLVAYPPFSPLFSLSTYIMDIAL